MVMANLIYIATCDCVKSVDIISALRVINKMCLVAIVTSLTWWAWAHDFGVVALGMCLY